jgi:hypothetical protein
MAGEYKPDLALWRDRVGARKPRRRRRLRGAEGDLGSRVNRPPARHAPVLCAKGGGAHAQTCHDKRRYRQSGLECACRLARDRADLASYHPRPPAPSKGGSLIDYPFAKILRLGSFPRVDDRSYQVFGRDYQVACGKAAHHPGMKRTAGHGVAPNLKSLYAEAGILRDAVLRRIVADGYAIDAESLPDARAIVTAKIGALVAGPEFEILLGYSHGEARVFALLVQACAAEILDTIGPWQARQDRVRCDPPLRLVADNEQ